LISGRGLLWFGLGAMRAGISPVNNAARLGAHVGEGHVSVVEGQSRVGNRCMFGVRNAVPP
jgi:hypothetical protein